MTAEKTVTHILKTANDVVVNQRGPQHGQIENSFQMAADLWSVYLRNAVAKDPATVVTAYDVAMMMDLLKTARATTGTPVQDHFVDKAGYSAIAATLAGIEAPELDPPAKVVTRVTTTSAANEPLKQVPVKSPQPVQSTDQLSKLTEELSNMDLTK